ERGLGRRLAPRLGHVRGDVDDALRRVVERAADVEALPRGLAVVAPRPEAEGTRDGLEAPAERERRRGQDDRALGEQAARDEPRDRERRRVQAWRTAALRLAASDPQHVALARDRVEIGRASCRERVQTLE